MNERSGKLEFVDLSTICDKNSVDNEDIKLKEVTRTDIEEWKATLIPRTTSGGNTYAPLSEFNIIHAVSTFFNFWKKLGYIEDSPVEQVDFNRPKKNDPRIYSLKQVKALLYNSEKVSLIRLFLIIALFGGLRTEEILRIKWRAISKEYKDITLDGTITKTSNRRIVHLPNNALVWLEPYLQQNPNPNELVMGNITKTTLFRYLDEIFDTCKLKRIRNGLRHTAATFHLRNSEDDIYCQKNVETLYETIFNYNKNADNIKTLLMADAKFGELVEEYSTGIELPVPDALRILRKHPDLINLEIMPTDKFSKQQW